MKQTIKKPVLIWGISLILILSFVLSGFNPVPSTAKAALPPITIQINESPWYPGFEALVNKYIKDTGNQVTLNRIPFNGMLEKSRNAVQASESEFDILTLNEQWYMQFYADGLVTPIKEIDPNFELDPQIIEYEWATRWDNKLKYSTKDGEIYGLPINGNIMLFFYRKDLFDANGLATPQTWDDVLAAAQKLNKPSKFAGYVVRANPPNWEFQAFLASYGTSIIKLDEQTGEWEVTINSPQALEALKMWLKLGVEYGPANYADNGQAEMDALMASDKAAQMVLTCAVATDFDNPEKSIVQGKVAAVPVPGATAGSNATMSGIWVMSIPHNLPKERKEAALAFLKWAMTKDAQLYYAQAGAIPVRQDVYEEMSQDPKVGWWMKAMADSTPFIHAQPRLVETPQIIEVIDRRLKQALISETTPEETLSEAAKEIFKILKDAGYKVKPLAE
ncbi:MAG TPA: sugar ABC transporter substrate-binding protein [Flexilinea sp.]|jgi:multiple sugar transport system substrate-binding protein|nr:sugar ABC transporter substrate-binding protein [Flexilinea sp.]HOG60737.1 sugar ABC transporter substrate-binding protein [Flexilinea sp.]HOU18656.1 sugar ABC transporter substrate-binding protein [Flexilinea sp.]HPJ64768.1 sugar ABC transporter substrate-binding protein [Flexilinea sp.]HPL56738.1 sugar ABC transporter substrate-binding protein [Flexilinea sp.]